MDFNIITFHTALSHGAVLQTYALQSFLQQMGYSVGVYDYRPQRVIAQNGIRNKVFNTVKALHKAQHNIMRNKFAEFVEEELNLNVEEKSKVFITGSDQVWNANGTMDPMFYLQFVGDETIRMSYAASLGKNVIPKHRKALYKKYISHIDFISVREEGAKEVIQTICDKQVNVNIDPTLLLDEKFWEKKANRVEGLPEKYILVYALRKPKNINILIQWLKKETGAKVVLIDNDGLFTYFIKHDKVYYDVGPKEFLGLVKNAESIVTTSFHGTAFSIIFKKEFYSIIDSRSPSRISNLLNKCGLNGVNETDKRFVRNNTIQWNKIEDILRDEKEKSKKYIESVYQTNIKEIRKKRGRNVEIIKKECMGCSACAAICPRNAIHMSVNSEGFYEPVINNTCINCGMCLEKCPVIKHTGSERLKTYYGWNACKDNRLKSSSGGIFKGLADKVIEKGGVVYGAVYSKDFKTVQIVDSDQYCLEEMQKSKYVASNVEGVFTQVKNQLEKERDVLFVGTPCQCAGLYNYLDHDYEKLIICDFVCGGLPSLKFYQEHMAALEERFHSKIVNINFRAKDKGWGKEIIKVFFENGKVYSAYFYLDRYFNAFSGKHISVRETCLSCQYANRHPSDITMADFWAYKKAGVNKNPDGLSLIIANTEKGEKIIEKNNKLQVYALETQYTNYTFKYKVAGEKSLKEREKFFALSKEKGFEKAAVQLVPVGRMNQFASAVKYKLHIK